MKSHLGHRLQRFQSDRPASGETRYSINYYYLNFKCWNDTVQVIYWNNKNIFLCFTIQCAIRPNHHTYRMQVIQIVWSWFSLDSIPASIRSLVPKLKNVILFHIRISEDQLIPFDRDRRYGLNRTQLDPPVKCELTSFINRRFLSQILHFF